MDQGVFVVIAKKAKGRERRRAFDLEKALARAQPLFHIHGYDGVGVATLSEALGIQPPSFYAAFRGKAALFARSVPKPKQAGALCAIW